jgi:hypothetical protein
MESKSFNELHGEKTKKDFINKIKGKLSPKSYYERHRFTVTLSNALAFLLSSLSALAGVTALFSLMMMMFGLDLTLLGMFESSPFISYPLALFSIVLLGLIEWGKHKMHSEGLREQFRNTDDNGKLEKRIALVLQLLSLVLSVSGALVISNEMAGTKVAKQITSIDADYVAKIEEAKQTAVSYKDANTYKGKLNAERGVQYSKLLQTSSDLEAQHNTALSDAGLLGKRGVTSETASLKVSVIMGGFQLLIELLLYGCLYWCIWFEYRVYMEEVKDEDKKKGTEKVSSKPFFQQQTSFPPLASNEGNLPTNKPVVVAGFTNRTQPTHAPIPQHKQPRTIVTQQPQHNTHTINTVISVGDITKIKNNVRTNYVRLMESYTDTRVKNVIEGCEELYSLGYNSWIDDNKMIKTDVQPSVTSGFMVVQYKNNKINFTRS